MTRAPTSSRPSPSAARSPGFAGCLFANWGNFVSPTIFGLAQSAQIIIWVIVGGRGTLIGPIVGCIGIQWLTTAFGANQPSGSDWWAAITANAPLILGVILIALRAAGAQGPGADAWPIAAQRLLRWPMRRGAKLGLEAQAGGGGLMAAPLLQTRDLSMHFGGVHAVRHVNFTLAEGELRCLIGPNGAGKSTFFKMLTGQLQPTTARCCSAARTSPAPTPTRSRGSASASRPRCRACSTA